MLGYIFGYIYKKKNILEFVFPKIKLKIKMMFACCLEEYNVYYRHQIMCKKYESSSV